MPYIPQDDRKFLGRYIITTIPAGLVVTPGELNYIITNILVSTNPKRYEDYNQLIGVLECIKLELYRRMVAPYEDKKKQEHGDVYPEEN